MMSKKLIWMMYKNDEDDEVRCRSMDSVKRTAFI